MSIANTTRWLGLACTSWTLAALLAAPSNAQILAREQVLADAPPWGDGIGTSVALGGQTHPNKLVLCGDTGANSNEGGAVLYDGGPPWAVDQFFAASDGSFGDLYGYSVAVWRLGDKQYDTVAIGAPNRRSGEGAVYVYRRGPDDSWAETRLIASDYDYNDWFGRSIALDYPMLVVGAPYEDSYRGAAYLFQHDGPSDTWNQVAKLEGENPGDRFGTSVAIDGEAQLDSRVIVGAPHFDTGSGQQAGAVYTYRNWTSGWEDEERHLSTQPGPDHLFGQSVSIFFDMLGAVAVVGEPGANSNRGAAHVFRSWNAGPAYTHEQRLEPANLDPSAGFGSAVSTNRQFAAIGAPLQGTGGSTYLYLNDQKAPGTWTESQELSGSGVGESFGRSVAVINSGPAFEPEAVLAVGAPGMAGDAGVVMHIDTDLVMSITPDQARVGETVTIQVQSGLPNGRLLVFAWEVDGFPFLWNIFGVERFDGTGTWSFTTTLPDLPVGTDIVLRSIGEIPSGQIGFSNRASLLVIQ